MYLSRAEGWLVCKSFGREFLSQMHSESCHKRPLSNYQSQVKVIPLTKGYVAKVDDEDYEDLAQHNWYAQVAAGGKVYACRWELVPSAELDEEPERVLVKMHKYLTYTVLDESDMVVDHIDGDSLNNQKANLRVCTQAQNIQNSKKRANTTSEYYGVWWRAVDARWMVKCGGEYIGSSRNEEEAAHIYDRAALAKYGPQAKVNFPCHKEPLTSY